MQRNEDFLYKIGEVRKHLKNRGFDGVEVKSQANFSCITRGRGFIGLASVVACGSLLITLDDVCLITENIEAHRLFTEQLNSNPMIKVMAFPWDEPQRREEILCGITSGLKVVAENELEAEFFKLRTTLSPYDIEDYRKLCHEAAVILEDICKGLTVGISEYQLAGIIAKELWSANIEPITTLIAFDERALLHRHPVMTENTLKNYALVGICGRRNGLIVSITRNVMIEKDDAMLIKHEKCAMVNAAFMEGLKIGNSLNDVFLSGIDQYAKQGYPLEYKEHHQGGLTGFVPREIRANIGCNHLVSENEAYAFNPTLQGSKCEDTVLVTSNGIEVLTYTGNYAYVSCELNGVLHKMPTVFVIN